MNENNEVADNPKMSPQRILWILVPFIMMAVLGIFLYPAFRDLGLWLTSYRWEVTEGRLDEARTESMFQGDVSTVYRPHVRYSYSVNEEDYVGTRLYFGNEENAYSGWAILVDMAIAPYENGSHVNVYYNPDDPAQSVLERRLGIERGYQWIFVAIIVIVSIAYVVALFRIIFGLLQKLFTRES